MTHDPTNSHLSAETMQAFLEGELSRRETSTTEEHLAACARCSAELDGWRALFADLGDLSGHRPHEGFHDRVMASVDMPESVSLGARVRDRIGEFTTGSHVAADILQDFIEGSLAARRAERVEAHLAACSDCAHEADVWLGVMRRLDELPSFAPAEGFANRVLAEVRLPEAPSLVARLRERLAGMAGRTTEHVPTGLLQDLVDDGLPAKAVAQMMSTCSHGSGSGGWAISSSHPSSAKRPAAAATVAATSGSTCAKPRSGLQATRNPSMPPSRTAAYSTPESWL